MTAQHYTCSVFYRGKYENGNENVYILQHLKFIINFTGMEIV